MELMPRGTVMRDYTFELDTSGKCEVIVEASNDKEAIEKLLKKDFVAKNQLESNIDFPSVSLEYIDEAMDYCSGWETTKSKEKSIEKLAEEKLVAPQMMVEKPLVVPTEGFKVNLNGRDVFVKNLEMCYQDLVKKAKGKFDNSEVYTVTYKHTKRHTDYAFDMEGSLKNNMFLKMNDGLVVNVQLI